MSFDLASYLEECKAFVEDRLVKYYTLSVDSILTESVKYSLLAGGKRLRPAFVFAAAEAVGGNRMVALPFAAAIEMIHTYSLIHDDLPAMDNDDLRRGKPANHIVFGEGAAILAGDALLTDAFALMAAPETAALASPATVLRAIFEIARAAGISGMVGGQSLDLQNEGRKIDLQALELMHSKKTGALIRASTVVGALAGGGSAERVESLSKYGDMVGLAFQIADDILDVEGAEEKLGKPVGSDNNRCKASYPALMGMAEAKKKALSLKESATALIEPFGQKGEPLKALAAHSVERLC